jgi:hypothetical protein
VLSRILFAEDMEKQVQAGEVFKWDRADDGTLVTFRKSTRPNLLGDVMFKPCQPLRQHRLRLRRHCEANCWIEKRS